ncbi:hypothetical protein [Serratia proteamaculans]|uniref:hypothetical protein n=1 Tax=Serratia proteamaculans TaxID=28151 RepID=UPI0039AEE815
MNSVWPINHPITADDPLVIKFANKIRKHSVPIEISKITKPKPIGFCYWNVDAAIEKFGGKMITGWLINKWPNSHLVAVHHAVYIDPKGKILDITETAPSEIQTKTSIFIPDGSHKVDLDKLPMITSKHYVFNENPFTKSYIESYLSLNSLEKELSKVIYSVGIRSENNKAIARELPLVGASLTQEQHQAIMDVQDSINAAKLELGTAMNALKSFTGN